MPGRLDLRGRREAANPQAKCLKDLANPRMDRAVPGADNGNIASVGRGMS